MICLAIPVLGRRDAEHSLSYRFENFTLELETRELRDGTELVHLEPQVFDALVYLVENQDRIVSKEEILDTIWQGRIVSESALTSRIKSIRRALGDDGKQQRLIRNFPSRGYRFMGEARKDTTPLSENQSTHQTGSAPSDIPNSSSLAILPFEVFENESSELVAIADGLVEDLTTLVTRIPLLSVASRTSTFALKNADLDAREAGARLGVRYILEGSLQRTRKSVRMNAQLIDASTGFHLWAEKFDQAEDDEDFDKLLLGLAARLELHLVHAIHRAVLAQGGELNAEQLLVQATTLLATQGWHRDTFEEAAGLLRRSIALDPNHALAHAELGLSLALGHRVGLLERSARLVEEVIAENERALDLGRTDSNVLGRVGCAFADVGQVDRAIPLLRRALDLNPSNGQAWAALGAAYQMENQHDRAIAPLEKGIENCSIDSRLAVWKTVLAMSYADIGRLEDAEEATTEGCQIDDKLYLPRLALAAVHLAQEKPDEARGALEDALRVKPDLSRYEIDCMVGRKRASALVGLLEPPRPDLTE